MRKSTRMSRTERILNWLQLVSQGSGRIWRPLAWPLKLLTLMLVTAVGHIVWEWAGLTYAELPLFQLIPWIG